MALMGATGEDGLGRLFDASPDRQVRTSAAAEMAFLAGLVAVLTAPFTSVRGVGLVAGVVAMVFVVVGTATTSRPEVAGRALVPAGLMLTLTAFVLIGMGYAGYDTTFGDAFLPTLTAWLGDLRSWLRLD